VKVLVANLGSTSFKYRLFDMADERQLARGGVERIGAAGSRCFVEITARRETTMRVPDHAVAVKSCLDQLTDPRDGCLQSATDVSADGSTVIGESYGPSGAEAFLARVSTVGSGSVSLADLQQSLLEASRAGDICASP
jgi:acetate kinase